MKRSQITVGNYPYAMYSFDYFLESMKRFHIEQIELWAAGPHFYLDDFDYFRIVNLGHKIRRSGLKARCLTPEQCQYPISISIEDEAIRRRSLLYFKKAIDAAEILEIPKVLVSPGISMLDFDREHGISLCTENLQCLAEYAQKHGVVLVLEALSRTTTFIAHTPSELKVLLNGSGCPEAVKPMLDTDGAARENLRPADYFNEFGSSLSHIHFTDGFPVGHVALGEGALDLCGYLMEIDQNHYTGDLALEILDRRYYRNPNLAVQTSLSFFCQYENYQDDSF